jgi:hypothetical protein
MMLFDPRAALAEIEKQASTPATSATSATQAPQIHSCVAKVADVAAPQRQIQEICQTEQHRNEADMRYGFAINGHPKTWTGNVVSLDAWRQLSDWDRHGPDGRLWNGITHSWETPE